MYKGVIFDFNGTLFFDDRFHIDAWDRISYEVCGRHATKETLDREYSGMPNKEILRKMSGGRFSEEQLVEYSEKKEALYREAVSQMPGGAKLTKGAEELFDALKENGIPFTIASASIRSNFEFFMEIFDLGRWLRLEDIVYDDGTYLNKIAMFNDAADRIGVHDDILVFEDSLSGIRAADAFGASIVAIRKDTLENEYPKFSSIIAVRDDLTDAYDLIRKQ